MYPKFFLGIIFFFIITGSFAQDPVFKWVRTIEGPQLELGFSIAIDADKTIITAGIFQNTVDFDPGPGVYNLSVNTPEPDVVNGYISAIDSAGQFVWAKKLGGEGLIDAVDLNNITLDKDGNVYVIGEFGEKIDFDPGPAVYNMESVNGRSFILKLDRNGNFIWAKQLATRYALSITTDPNNDVLITGTFHTAADFDPGPGVFIGVPPNGGFGNIWLLKLTAGGDFVWMRQFNGSNTNESTPLTVRANKQGQAYVAGYFQSTVDFDPGTAAFTMTPTGLLGRNAFIVKLSGSGDFIWARQFTSSVKSDIVSMEIDNSGNVITSGNFTDATDFDPGAGTYTLSTQTSQDHVFISKLSPDGNFIFAKTFEANNTMTTNAMTLDNGGDIYLSGHYRYASYVDFDPGPGVYTIPSGFIYITRLSNSGEIIWAKGLSPANGTGEAVGGGIKTDIFKNVYTQNVYAGTADFDPGTGTFLKTSSGYFDPFLHKMTQCKNAITSLSAVSCGSYTLNGKVYDSSGVYYQAIPLSGGCDSIIQLSLTIQRLRTNVSAIICEGQTYQTYANAGVYTDTLTSSQGCDSIRILTLAVRNKPLPALGPDKKLCQAKLTLSPGTFNSYRWNNGSLDPQLTVTAPGLYWVMVTDGFNCAATDSVFISAAAPIVVRATSSNEITCSSGSTQLEASGAQSYTWLPTTGVSNPAISNPVASPSTTTTYTVTGIDAAGCVGKADITVKVSATGNGRLFMPSAFTPDRNGRNDCYGIRYPGTFRSLQFVIYNRWGEKVFSATHVNDCWDGRYKGQEQPSGAYAYYIKGISDCGVIDMKGTINLLR